MSTGMKRYKEMNKCIKSIFLGVIGILSMSMSMTSCGGGLMPQPPQLVMYGDMDGYVFMPYGSSATRIANDVIATKPAKDAVVSATCGDTVKSAATNADGYFYIQKLPVASCLVEISLNGFTKVPYQISVTTNQTVRVGGAQGTTMTPITHGVIRVTSNVAGGVIVLDGELTDVIMPSDLYCDFPYVQPGNHTIGITKEGFESVSPVEVEVLSGSIASVEIRMTPIGNRPPVANAGAGGKWLAGYKHENYRWDGDVVVYDLIPISYALDGSASSDLDGDELTYIWEQVEGPIIEIKDMTSSIATFTPIEAGVYKFNLRVNDRYHDSVSDDIDVEIAKIGGKIVYTSTLYQKSSDIFKVNADGTGFERLTTDDAFDGWPRWSPDGTQIVYFSNRDGNAEIYKMNADGSGQTRLTDNAAYDGVPDWCADNKIYFTSDRDGNKEIYSMNSDGSNQQRLTVNTRKDTGVACSADASKLLYMRVYGGDNYEVMIMDTDGGNEARLTDDTKVHSFVNWTPDGRILYTTADSLGGEDKLYVMNADGTNKQIWNVPAGENDIEDAVMTDDGNFIFYVKDLFIHVMYSDGSANLNLGVYGAVLDYHPGP
ncbi:MAG: translocation protein TolB [bacterium ADurb.Bin236]|nr:MAG: translocation protein TolB [bacterium ADurb.Bin236]